MASLELNAGTRLALDDAGVGAPPLVFVHGWCSNRSHWAAQVEHFAARHRTVAVDRRGHGGSTVTSDGYEPRRHAADLAELLDQLGLTDAVAIGHAGGAPAILALARSRPDLVRAVVLVEAIVRPTAPAGSGLDTLAARLAGRRGRDALAGLYRSFFADPEATVARDAVADALATPMDVVVAELRSLDLDTETIARELTQAVLWVSVEPADRAHLSAVFAHVCFAEVGGGGHFPQLEAPDQLNEIIDDFVSTLGSAPPR